MSVGSYAVGLAALAAVILPLWIGARAVRATVVPDAAGAPAALVETVLALGALTVLAELLGAVGALDRAPLVIAALAAGGVATLWTRRKAATRPAPERSTPLTAMDRVLAGGALLAGAIVLGQWGVAAGSSLEHGMRMPDTLYYHLPFAAWFAQSGSLTELNHVGLDHLSTPTFYPAGSELLHGVGIVLLERDLLSPLINVGFVAVALLAGWCIGQARGAGPLGLAAVSVAVSFPILWQINAGQAGNDAASVALFLSAAGLLAAGEARGAWIPLAGVAAGLALGVKLTLLAPVLAISVAVIVLAPRGERLRTTAIWAGAAFAAGGFWWLRNLFQAGSPLPWFDVDVGPLDYTAPARPQSEGLEFSVLDYATDVDVWRDHFGPDLETALGGAWPLLLLLAAAGVVTAIASRVSWQRAFGVVAAVGFVAYLITPNGAPGPEGAPWGFGLNLRFAAPPLALGLALLAVAPWVRGVARQRVLLAVLLVALLANVLAPMGVAPERRLEAVVIAVALAALAGAALLLRRAGRPLALACVAAVVLVLAVSGWIVQRDYLRDRYSAPAPNLPAAAVWARDVTDTRIGVLGFVPQYPLFGLDLSNRVEAAGRRVENGGIARFRNCREWRRAVNERGYRFLVLTPVPSPNPGEPPPDPVVPEVGWTESDPAARALLRDGRTRVFRVTGRLDPAACDRRA